MGSEASMALTLMVCSAVRFAMDRAGMVGADGATHCGFADITYMGCLPNMVLMAPSNEGTPPCTCVEMYMILRSVRGKANIQLPFNFAASMAMLLCIGDDQSIWLIHFPDLGSSTSLPYTHLQYLGSWVLRF